MSEKTLQFESWYCRRAGAYVFNTINEKIQDKLSNLFGYYALEMGVHTQIASLLQTSRIKENITVYDSGVAAIGQGVVAEPEFLPIVFDNIDLVIASHVFEGSDYPHQVLREIDRVLVSEGHCLILGFNPYSYVGMTKFLRLNKCFQQEQTFRSMGKMNEWLKVLGYKVISTDSFGFRPSIKNKKLFDALMGLEKVGERFLGQLGSVYLIHAKKTELAYHPVTSWRSKKILSGKSAIPAASKEGSVS